MQKSAEIDLDVWENFAEPLKTQVNKQIFTRRKEFDPGPRGAQSSPEQTGAQKGGP